MNSQVHDFVHDDTADFRRPGALEPLSVRRWPGSVRLGIIVGASLALWGMIAAVAL